MPRSSRRWLTRRFQTSFTVSAAGVITNENGEVLLLNHVLRPDSGWGLPGGFLNENEDPARAVEREVLEETGLRVRALRPLTVTPGELRPHLTVVYLCAYEGGTFRPSAEISEAKFFAVDQLPSLIRGQRELIINSHAPT